MEKLRVGYGRVDITPDGPINLAGYGNDAVRISEEVRDPLYATCIAFTDPKGSTALLFTTDMTQAQELITLPVREAIAQEHGIPFENIMVSATHTHSAPAAYRTDEVMMAYVQNARAHSLYQFNVDVQPSDRLLTLATMGGEDTLVLIYRMAREGEGF